jgi:hypothetical protein
MASLYKHIEAVQTHPLLGSCDFKLASTRSSISSRASIANEVGFDSLSVRLVKVSYKLYISECVGVYTLLFRQLSLCY